VQEYRGSGLTMAEFARRERIKYSTLVGWVYPSGERPHATSLL
jgi:hypothetical protein